MTDDVCMFVKSLILNKSSLNTYVKVAKVYYSFIHSLGGGAFPGGSAGEESAHNAGDLGLIAGLETPPGEGYGDPLQYSCLDKPHGQKCLAGYSPWGGKELEMTERLSLSLSFPHHCLLKVEGTSLHCMLSCLSCLTVCGPVDCSLPGSSVHGILQARILEWVMPSSRASSQPRDRACISCSYCIAGRFFTTEPLPHPNLSKQHP